MDEQPDRVEDENRETLESLDTEETKVEDSGALAPTPAPTDEELAAPPGQTGESGSNGPGGPSPKKPRNWLRGPNIYLGGLVLIVIVAIGLTIYAFSRSGQSSGNNTPLSQSLSPQALKQLASSDVTVGGPKQTLTIQSNAIIDGQVLVKRGLQVAGSLEIGGNLSLPNIVVSGTSQFGSVQINKSLAVAGAETVQGQLAVQNNLTVEGGGNFSGPVTAPQITANSLELNGDLNLTHHIDAGGGTPGRSNGNALGSGGSASISGSDTAGVVDISTGGGPPAGCFIQVNFSTPFNATPVVVITPVGSTAAQLQYYVTRTTNNFDICSASTPPAYANFSFDYIAFD